MVNLTITIDSFSNFRDLEADGTYTQRSYQQEITDMAAEHGVRITAFDYDEYNDVITVDLTAPSRDAVRQWISEEQPELSDEELDDLVS